MYRLFLLPLLMSALTVRAQQESEDPINIVRVGKLLYREEMSSWIGTDVFLQLGDRNKIGGYFSYPCHDSTRCIYYSRGDSPVVIGTITFDSTFKTSNATTNFSERIFSPVELDYYNIRTTALKDIHTDTFYKRYKNTDLNLIPVVGHGSKQVYILTGPQQNGVVIFGNDYLLTFDNNNTLVKKERLHNSAIFFDIEKYKDAVNGIHTHVPEHSKFITPTDICTLMLYEKYTNWDQYYVISSEYVSIWDCKQNDLNVITTEAWGKIMEDQEKRKK